MGCRSAAEIQFQPDSNIKEMKMTVKNADLQARKNAATPRGVGVMCDFYAARAENAEL